MEVTNIVNFLDFQKAVEPNQALIWASLVSKYWTLLSLFSRKKCPFSQTDFFKVLFKTFSCASALFINFWTLLVISRISSSKYVQEDM